MEQTMAPGTGLTARQKQLLELAISEPYITKHFYLTGGTALASWYLHHRESYDLDFFSEQRFDYDTLIRWFREKDKYINPRAMIFDEDWGFLEVKIRYQNNERLKRGITWKGLAVDSIYDIAINKLQTISERPRTRDYVDLYFILKTRSWGLGKLIVDTVKKFGGKIDVLQLSKNFMKSVEHVDLPVMLIPFDRKDMDRFYMKLASSLKKDIFV